MLDIPLAAWQPNTRLCGVIEAITREEESAGCGYHYSDDWQLVIERLALNYDSIVAMAIRGVPSKTVAALFGVTREAIDQRLRPLGLKNPPGVRGRPPASCGARWIPADRHVAQQRRGAAVE
jgi:hypothetical protein